MKRTLVIAVLVLDLLGASALAQQGMMMGMDGTSGPAVGSLVMNAAGTALIMNVAGTSMVQK